jgi:hypothetical protein
LPPVFPAQVCAEAWDADAERAVYRGNLPILSRDDKTSFASLIELRIKDMAEVGKPLLLSEMLDCRT